MGAGGRHKPVSVEMTREQEGWEPGRLPGQKTLPGPKVHLGQAGEPGTERQHKAGSLETCLVPFGIC